MNDDETRYAVYVLVIEDEQWADEAIGGIDTVMRTRYSGDLPYTDAIDLAQAAGDEIESTLRWYRLRTVGKKVTQ